jgi:hypothetical protein
VKAWRLWAHSVRRLISAAACVTAACSGSPSAPTSQPPTPLKASLQSAAWQTIADPDPFPLSNNAGSELTFEFPTTGSMHYLFTASSLAAIRGTVAVTLRVATTGPVVFSSLDPVSASCSIPPSVRPFFWANQNGNGQYDRWWSNPRSFSLAPGTTTIAVPLTPESWSSVNGRFGNADSEARFGFDKAILNVTRLGLTFGGGCSFGHGINVQGGRAEFFLTEYAIR